MESKTDLPASEDPSYQLDEDEVLSQMGSVYFDGPVLFLTRGALDQDNDLGWTTRWLPRSAGRYTNFLNAQTTRRG